MRMAILVDGNVVDIRKRHTRLLQAIADRFGWEAGPMFDAAKAFLFNRGDELSIPHECRRGIAMEGIQAENDHRAIGSMCNSLGQCRPAARNFACLGWRPHRQGSSFEYRPLHGVSSWS